MNKDVTDATNRTALTRPLHEMFAAIPRHYDLTNIVITWGMVNHWRQEAARECLATHPSKVLDLACGTGDLALTLVRQAKYEVKVTGLDYCQPMLGLAATKALPLAQKPSFVHGYADALPFPDGYFDCVVISFAFRNLTYKNPLAQANLAEVFRILAPGGKFVIIETCQPESKLIRKRFHLYLRCWVFPVGWLLSGNHGAYAYLAESAARFYTPEGIKQLLVNAGFSQIRSRPFLFGAIGLHTAIKTQAKKDST